jgi:hypothetical protein
MTIVLIIETNGTVKELAMKQYVEADLYKRAGFKTPDGFQQQCTFSMDSNVVVRLYGKSVGKSNRENKYEFPPPVDKTLFFGSCLLIAMSATTAVGEPINLTKGMWESLYTNLYGGFDSLVEVGGEDADAAEEAMALRRDRAESLELGHALTKQGYAKDGFIVDDDSTEEAVDTEEEEEEEDAAAAYFVPIVKPPVKPKRVPAAKTKGTALSERRSKRANEPATPIMAFTDQDNLVEEVYES